MQIPSDYDSLKKKCPQNGIIEELCLKKSLLIMILIKAHVQRITQGKYSSYSLGPFWAELLIHNYYHRAIRKSGTCSKVHDDQSFGTTGRHTAIVDK